MHGDDTNSAAIEAAAAEWLARRRDGLSASDEAAYQAWLGAHPRHAAAMAELQAAWATVSFPARVGRGREAVRALDRRAASRRRRPYVIATAGLAAAAALALVFAPRSANPDAAIGAVAVAVRPNLATLPDGSVVELNKGAEIVSDFTPTRRSVRLLQGEAFFSVTKDPARPFVVSAGGLEVRAVGTAFAVRSDPAGVGVLVTEGRVAVGPVAAAASQDAPDLPSTPAPPIYLDAGASVAVGHAPAGAAPAAVVPVSAREIDAALAWRRERVEFSRMPLSEAVALFNRRNRVQLAVADRATATIPISGIFWADDAEGFVRLLESGSVVRAQRSGDILSLRSR